MNQIRALLRTTWWLWPILFGGLAMLVVFVERALLVCFPLCVVIFLYFAFVRFDENGDRRT